MRILVAEDDEHGAAMIERGLRDDGYSVDVADNGVDALWHATEVAYDAIVLDIMLPGMDGFEICRRMREAERWTPVLTLTARTDVRDRVTGLDAGADDYLGKPFDLDELSARLRALLRRGTPERPAVLTAGDLGLDPATRRAWRGTTELEVSAKEVALLELFLRRPGEVLTRTVILEHVWDSAYDGVNNVVDQYVAFLRRKIDKPCGVEQLETVRGAGHRLRSGPITAPAEADGDE